MRDPKKIERLKTALERNLKALELRPTVGRGTAVTTVRIRDACTAEIEDGGRKMIADESVKDGGNGEGPDPGVYGRAALGTCLAIGYAQWAAKFGVALDSIEVEVQADYDAVTMFGLDDSRPPGWSAMRYVVRIASSAPEADVQRVIDYADAHSPLLDDFARPLSVTRELYIAGPAKHALSEAEG
jgi:uncharacterized OsmC-like protein